MVKKELVSSHMLSSKRIDLNENSLQAHESAKFFKKKKRWHNNHIHKKHTSSWRHYFIDQHKAKATSRYVESEMEWSFQGHTMEIWCLKNEAPPFNNQA